MSAQKRNVKWECHLSAKPLSLIPLPKGHASPLSPSPPGPARGTVRLRRFASGWGGFPAAFPCPSAAGGVALLWRRAICVSVSLLFLLRWFSAGATCLPVLSQHGMGVCPALYLAGMRNRSPSEIGWWGPGAGVCVCVLGTGGRAGARGAASRCVAGRGRQRGPRRGVSEWGDGDEVTSDHPHQQFPCSPGSRKGSPRRSPPAVLRGLLQASGQPPPYLGRLPTC